MIDTMMNMARVLLDGKENNVISPVSIYRLMTILAEITDGNTKKEITDFLGDTETWRSSLRQLLEDNRGGAIFKIADSIWINPNFAIKEKKIIELWNLFRCDAKSVPMGTKQADREIQEWINEKTEDLLKEETSALQTDSYTTAVLLSTIYLRAKWGYHFKKENNYVGFFINENKEKIRCEYMTEKSFMQLYSGRSFSSVCKRLSSGFVMEFLLPNEGISIGEMLSDSELYEFLENGYKRDDKESYVLMRVPKFVVRSKDSLTAMIRSLGVKDVFDRHTADFSPFVKHSRGDDLFYISRAEQTARVKIDEEGLEGAAWTRADLTFGCLDPYWNKKFEIHKFYLERPFVFLVSKAGLPVFAGTVVEPLKTNKNISEPEEIDEEKILEELRKNKERFNNIFINMERV